MSCVCFVLFLFPVLTVNAILACFDVRLERFSLDCRKGLVLVLVLVLLRPLVGYCIYFGFGFTTVK